MKELYTEIAIHAPAGRVWKVLTDFAHYPDWNPFMQQVEGEAKLGEQLNVLLHPPGAKATRVRPTITRVIPERELRWRGHLFIAGFFDGEHTFMIEPQSETLVQFVQREQFDGILLPLLARQLDTATRQGFIEMNQALKERAET